MNENRAVIDRPLRYIENGRIRFAPAVVLIGYYFAVIYSIFQ